MFHVDWVTSLSNYSLVISSAGEVAVANDDWENGPVPKGSTPVLSVPLSPLALLPKPPWSAQDSQQCSQQTHALLSLFFFPFWARLSADTADELFRAHQRPWGFVSPWDDNSFKSSEVINAKARESINFICFQQSRTKLKRGKKGGWKLYPKRFWNFYM